MDEKHFSDKRYGWKIVGILGGILFVNYVIPILESMTGLIQTKIAEKIQKLNYTMAQDEEEIKEIQMRLNSEPCQAIGFEVPTMGDEYYYEESCKKNRKN